MLIVGMPEVQLKHIVNKQILAQGLKVDCKYEP